MKAKRWLSAGCMTALMVLLALSAAAVGQADITPQTTMKEIRENESIQGSGYYVYSREQDRALQKWWTQNWTLEDYAGTESAQDTADGLNRVIENHNRGIQVTYKVYTEQEIAQIGALDKVELYYFPVPQPGAKYALIVVGGANMRGAELEEGASTAVRLNALGYAAFVLRYRHLTEAADDAPVQDVGRAVEYITIHAKELQVDPEGYAVLGYSAGGHLAGLFGTQLLGYPNYDVPKPGLLILAYGINDFSLVKPVYHLLLDAGSFEQHYYDLTVSEYVTKDYPATYHWYGKNDLTLFALCAKNQNAALEQALEQAGVPHKLVVYQDAPHAIGTGVGTDAEGWLTDAAAFWEEQTAEEAEIPAEKEWSRDDV
ncbi:MAG: alpha/beta hydrolase [Faecalibacterium sp.]